MVLRFYVRRWACLIKDPRDAGIALSCHVGDLLQRGGALQEALARLKHKKRFQVLELGSGCGMVRYTMFLSASIDDVGWHQHRSDGSRSRRPPY